MIISQEYLERLLKTNSVSSDHMTEKTLSNDFPSAARTTEGNCQEGLNDDPEAAFRKIERLLSVRDRSVSETLQRLLRDHFTQRATDEAIERALRCGYLDDARFADGFIRSRLRANKGTQGIVRELKNHGIDAFSIVGFPDTYVEEAGSQLESALCLLERKPPRAKNKQQAAYAKLIRNGFSSAIASSAVKHWIATQN